MLIIKGEKTVPFEDIDLGEVFKYGDAYCMLICNIEAGGYFGADIRDGEVREFAPKTPVMPVEATVTIK